MCVCERQVSGWNSRDGGVMSPLDPELLQIPSDPALVLRIKACTR